jgi:protein-tyrosine-phosphatase
VIGAGTHPVEDVIRPGDLVVSVCDQAHEAMADYPVPPALHWAIPDPVETNSDRAFESAYAQISRRVDRLAAAVSPDAG